MRNPTPEFKFATVKSTSYESFFRYAETDVLKRMGVFMRQYDFKNTTVGVEMVKNG